MPILTKKPGKDFKNNQMSAKAELSEIKEGLFC